MADRHHGLALSETIPHKIPPRAMPVNREMTGGSLKKRTPPMKTINKVLETMLSKPATPTWTDQRSASSARDQFDAPVGIWAWGG